MIKKNNKIYKSWSNCNHIFNYRLREKGDRIKLKALCCCNDSEYFYSLISNQRLTTPRIPKLL